MPAKHKPAYRFVLRCVEFDNPMYIMKSILITIVDNMTMMAIVLTPLWVLILRALNY